MNSRECSLDPMIRSCSFVNKGICCYQESCSFQKDRILMKEHALRKEYKRPERWYAKYTMGRNGGK